MHHTNETLQPCAFVAAGSGNGAELNTATLAVQRSCYVGKCNASCGRDNMQYNAGQDLGNELLKLSDAFFK
jgi:hypothetical protein